MKTRYEIESIKRGKKRLRLTLIIGAAALVVLAAVIAVAIIVGNLTADETSAETPEIKDGEAIYRGITVAYPTMATSDIFRITVNNKKSDGEFTLVKDDLSGGDFLLTYMEGGRGKDILSLNLRGDGSRILRPLCNRDGGRI